MLSMAGTDDKLLTDFVAGDPEAFVELYRRHLPAVLDFFLRRAGDPELAADLTAETFAVEGGWRTRLAGAWRSSRWRWTTRCLRLQQDPVRAYLPQVPAPRRAPMLRLATRLIAFDLALISRGPFDVICTVSHSGSGGGAGCGANVAEVVHGQTPSEDNGTFVGVVPDGVASVTIRVAAQPGRPAGSATGTVQGNMFAVRVPGVGDQVDHGVTAIWRSASGAVVKTLRLPGAGARRAYCRHHEVVCVTVAAGQAQSSVSSSSATTAASAPRPGGLRRAGGRALGPEARHGRRHRARRHARA